MSRTACMILRKTPFQESSLILACLSPDFGRVDLLCKGARAIGKKSFPLATLFREISIDYREPKTASGLVLLRAPELIRSHDDIAGSPDTYLAACGIASFLLRHTKSMVPVPETFQALSHMFEKAAAAKEAQPWFSYIKLVFLNENGFVSISPDKQYILDSVLSFALGKTQIPPPFTVSYRDKFICWIEALSERFSA